MRVIFTLVQRIPPSKDALDKGLSTYFLMLLPPLVRYLKGNSPFLPSLLVSFEFESDLPPTKSPKMFEK